MKLSLAFIAALMCFQGTSSLFYGANVDLPQAKELSSGIQKCVTVTDAITPKLCSIGKKALKFSQTKYKNVANSVTEMQYTFQSIKEFYNQFLKCLNDQAQKQTAEVTMRNIDILLYQVANFVTSGLDKTFKPAADTLGAVYGSSTTNNMNTIYKLFTDEFKAITEALKSLKTQFQLVIDSGMDITSATVSASLASEAFTNLVNAFKDIEVTSKQASTVFDGLLEVVTALDDITVSVESTQTTAYDSQKKAQYNVDLQTQSATKTFASKSLAFAADVEASFNNVTTILGNLYVGDSDVQGIRKIIEFYSSHIRVTFDAFSSLFNEAISNNIITLTKQSNMLTMTVNTLIKLLKNLLEDAPATASKSVKECFKNNTATAVQLVSDMGFSAAQCSISQQTVAQQAQSLFIFFIEGVAIEARGAADRLCSCAVTGDATTIKRAKACLVKIANELATLPANQQEYLAVQLKTLTETLTGTQQTFAACAAAVKTKYEAKVGVLNNSLNACLIG